MTTWNNEQKRQGQTGLTYNASGYRYNNVGVTYWGKLVTLYTNLSKTITSFTNATKSTATSFTNLNKN